ncbi:MAG: hypothetical protein LWX11_03695 [Firmicutes bacterium]|nr:hypothetical protein [Bacillota bacterium]
MKTFALALVSAALVAQSPAPAPAPVDFSQALRAAGPEVTKLLAEFKNREAAARMESILPKSLPAWDKSKPETQMNSYTAYREYAYAYHLAGKAADAAGQWERAVELHNLAKDTAKTNADNVNETFPLIVKYFTDSAEGSKRTLAENADFIKELRAKPNPDAGDKQQLDLIKGEEEGIEKSLKSAEIFKGYIETAKKEADYYGKFATEEAAQVKDQVEQLETYKFKNDKVKFVEGIMSSKTFLDQQFPDKGEKVRYLHRLNVMDPSNRKVIKELETLTGVAIPVVGEDKTAPKGRKGR